MISKKIEDALNAQVEMESSASTIYLSMASWCEHQGLEGCAEFMYEQSEEEKMHMMKLFHYINDVEGKAIVPGISKPPTDFSSVQDMFKEVYRLEREVTISISNILDLCHEENDHMTKSFMQWYINEQREEEAMMRTILDRIKLIGDGPQHLYFINQEISKLNALNAQKSAAENTPQTQ